MTSYRPKNAFGDAKSLTVGELRVRKKLCHVTVGGIWPEIHVTCVRQSVRNSANSTGRVEFIAYPSLSRIKLFISICNIQRTIDPPPLTPSKLGQTGSLGMRIMC